MRKNPKKAHKEKRRSKKTILKKPRPPVHPWRVCPYGEHRVRTHPLHIPPSKAHPAGSITSRDWHCARNPTGKDQLYPEEIQEIATQHFSDLMHKPCPLDLGFGDAGHRYDTFIAGWVQYWNEVLKPDVPLDPNLVKALVASESGFSPTRLANKKNSNSVRGLTQITNDTRKILGGDHDDLKDHFITVTKEELNDPNINICAGVRWLFEKRRLAAKSKKPASWIETIWEYKGVKVAKTEKDAEKIKRDFNRYYKDLQKCGKKT